MTLDPAIHGVLQRGIAIPAHPLALTSSRKLDERRQRALSRYYIAAGAGGLAVAVHTTQFAIRNPAIGLFKPVLELAAEEMSRADRDRSDPLVRIAGICGKTDQAVAEAGILRDLGYHAGLLSLAAMKDSGVDSLVEHARIVSRVIPIVGFYLQPSVGGRVLPFEFWRRFAEIPGVAAIKIAPFNRYQTIDVIRAVVESGRDDLARRGLRYWSVGPVLADSESTAASVTAALLHDIARNESTDRAFIDVPSHSPLVSILPRWGFVVQRRLSRMARPPARAPLLNGPLVAAAAGLELG